MTRHSIESDGQPISPDALFHSDYRSFIEATRILTANALDRCESMGDYNVAWKIKDGADTRKYIS